MKGTLFFCAGLLIKRLGVRNVSEMAGAARKMPITMAAFAVATLGLIGTPPLAGFVSKWYLGQGMLEVDEPLYLIVLLGGALIAAVYLLPILYTAYFRQPASVESTTAPLGREASASMLAPAVVGALLTIVLGIAAAVPGLPLSLAQAAAQAFFP
jgi:multicomponent Na+:H+ antiporter subunit D